MSREVVNKESGVSACLKTMGTSGIKKEEVCPQNWGKLVAPSRYHRILVGIELVKARETFNMTQQEFADLCSWSRQYQQRLESATHEVSTTIIEKILMVLSDCNKTVA